VSGPSFGECTDVPLTREGMMQMKTTGEMLNRRCARARVPLECDT
jgi:hypothetical protein